MIWNINSVPGPLEVCICWLPVWSFLSCDTLDQSDLKILLLGALCWFGLSGLRLRKSSFVRTCAMLCTRWHKLPHYLVSVAKPIAIEIFTGVQCGQCVKGPHTLDFRKTLCTRLMRF